MRNFSDIQEILKQNNELDLSKIKKIYLLGSTGAGKTSLVRNIIDTVDSAFPTTTQTRTTVAPTEYIIKKGLPLKTIIILKKKEDIVDSIEMLIKDAIKKALDNSKINKDNLDDIVLKLEESSDEKFRLKYMVSKETLDAKAQIILSNIIPLIIERDNDETLFDTLDIKTEINNITTSFLNEIKDNFFKLVDSDYELFSNKPLIIDNIEKKSDFINRNKTLLKTDIGSISLLVEYIRIEGEELLSKWLQHLDLEFLLIDGEGIGHSLEERRDTLSIRHYDFFDYCNHILLMEKGEDPFISGGQGAIESIFLNGYKNKFKLIFSKIDRIENSDRNGFLRRRLANLENALKEQKVSFSLENKNTYKLEKLNESKISEYSQKEIKRLFEDMKNQDEVTFIPLEYDFNNFFANLNTKDFISYFKEKIDNEHWTRVKAFTKQMKNNQIEYDSIKPISEILLFIMKDINLFLQTEEQFNSDIMSSQNEIKQDFSTKLRNYIYHQLIIQNNHLWNQAYLEKGRGSHKQRKDFIFKNIIEVFLPSNEDKKFIEFKLAIKELLLDAGARELASAKRINIKEIDIQKIYKDKNFKWEVGEDTNILIGKNGTGKSTILKLIHACINKDKEVLEKFNFPGIHLKIKKFYEDTLTQDIIISNNKNFSDVKSILVDTFDGKNEKCEKSQNDLDCKLLKLVDKFGQHQRELNNIFEKESKDISEKISVIVQNITNATPEILQQFQELTIKENIIKEGIYKKINLFKEIINNFLRDTEKEIVLNDSKEALLIKLREENKKLFFNEISSGEKQILIIFLTILLEGDEPFILLMDEPETSLHVEWQFKLIESIKKLNDNIQIIIATHNPLLMLNRNSNEIGVIEIGEESVNTEGKGTKYLDISAVLIRYFGLNALVGKDMQDLVENLFELKEKRENDSQNFNDEDKNKLELIENELEGTMASRFIYDRAYFKFLAFVKENEDINFSGLKQLNKQDFQSLLNKYKDKF
ncbi:MAG: AAA family ATPase [Sulfurovum sp.]|nr:AAA family ATPase [Sulfurovum sp.]